MITSSQVRHSLVQMLDKPRKHKCRLIITQARLEELESTSVLQTKSNTSDRVLGGRKVTLEDLVIARQGTKARYQRIYHEYQESMKPLYFLRERYIPVIGEVEPKDRYNLFTLRWIEGNSTRTVSEMTGIEEQELDRILSELVDYIAERIANEINERERQRIRQAKYVKTL